MPDIQEAKDDLVRQFGAFAGFVGAGIGYQGSEVIQVYVSDAATPAARELRPLEDDGFEGHPVVVETTGEIEAF